MSTMVFCRECNNILYPRENKETKRLIYACRNCDRTEAAETNCVYRNEIKRNVALETTQVFVDVAADPTLPRTNDVKCSNCGHQEAVFFQSTSRGDADAMVLFYACTASGCGFRWRDQ